MLAVTSLFAFDDPHIVDPDHGRIPRAPIAGDISETPAEIANQQLDVGWHLVMLARLSAYRARAGMPGAP